MEPLRRLGRTLTRLPTWGLILMARVYQITLGPILGGHCRFTPTCSAYFIEAVGKYGALKGVWRGILRVCRCHPWHQGGFDPP